MKIVTGYTGAAHITSNDDQGLLQGVFGTESYVMNVGDNFVATIISANEVQLGDGEGVLQGVHFRTDPGLYDSVTIDNGAQGMKRTDLICARYTKNGVSGVESVNWVVIKGTPAASSPATPSHTEGDVLAGDLVADFPVYKVNIDGLAIDSVTLIAPLVSGSAVRGGLVIKSVTSSIAVGTSAASVTLALPLAWLADKTVEFVCWIEAVSDGWVCPLSIEDPTIENAVVWKPNTSYITGGLGGNIKAYALFRKI